MGCELTTTGCELTTVGCELKTMGLEMTTMECDCTTLGGNRTRTYSEVGANEVCVQCAATGIECYRGVY